MRRLTHSANANFCFFNGNYEKIMDQGVLSVRLGFAYPLYDEYNVCYQVKGEVCCSRCQAWVFGASFGEIVGLTSWSFTLISLSMPHNFAPCASLSPNAMFGLGEKVINEKERRKKVRI